jgi:hypothetical protein
MAEQAGGAAGSGQWERNGEAHRDDGSPAGHGRVHGPAAAVPARDLRTAAALLKIATVFNDDYDSGMYGPVWDR